MSPSHPSTSTSPEEQILLTVADQSKLDLVMELLSHFDLVRAERVQARLGAELAVVSPEEVAALTPQQKSELFLQSAGMWKDRDIDARELRERAWQRGNSGS